MPTNTKLTNTSKNTNTINVKVIVGDTRKKKPRRKAASSDSPPPPPPPSVNYIQPSAQPPAQTQANSYPDPDPGPPRSGASMFNRPYDVADAAVGTVGEAVPEGLASNYDTYQANRARYFMSLQEQMEDALARTQADTTPPFGAQENEYTVTQPDDPPPHRSVAFALPPTLLPSTATLALEAPPTETTAATPPPSDAPSPSKGRSRRRRRGPNRPPAELRDDMIEDGVINERQRASQFRRQAYERWLSEGKDPESKPDFTGDDA